MRNLVLTLGVFIAVLSCGGNDRSGHGVADDAAATADSSTAVYDPNWDFIEHVSDCEILKGEIRDTIVSRIPPENIDMKWIFNQMLSVQSVGRPKDNNHYELKTESDFSGDDSVRILVDTPEGVRLKKRVCLSEFLNSFVGSGKNDTIYFEEKIFDEGNYKLSIWNSLDSVYSMFGVDRTRERYIALFKADGVVKPMIGSWRKDELMAYGSMMPEEHTNPYSVCATRVIITPYAVSFEMFKFYEPYKLIRESEQRKKKS